MSKPFHELTSDEAYDLAFSCKHGARSEAEVRERLTEAGFNGAAAAVCFTTNDRRTDVMIIMVMVYGPHGEVINA